MRTPFSPAQLDCFLKKTTWIATHRRRLRRRVESYLKISRLQENPTRMAARHIFQQQSINRVTRWGQPIGTSVVFNFGQDAHLHGFLCHVRAPDMTLVRALGAIAALLGSHSTAADAKPSLFGTEIQVVAPVACIGL